MYLWRQDKFSAFVLFAQPELDLLTAQQSLSFSGKGGFLTDE